ncbi:hypothetical protein FOZ61_006751 [Perkinsus olseni]|uniref:PITH domain-containing protein n=1 Tax=Perkinsus olseni TaxID=32597 RepID=A0A7J6LBY8_PEROL|nr:hypothetical protein FOZ61_006751 [Perkinsus olseni]KAF4674754.1 hypothetical protein FOL46_004014 [Perkinsus olseni]
MQVNTEASNTSAMRQLNLKKQRVCESALEHKEVDLSCDSSGLLDLKVSTVLNANPDFGSLADILAPNTENAVVSDADQQLLIKLSFRELVHAKSIIIGADHPPQGGEEDEDSYSAPMAVKVFANQPAMDFNDIESGSVSPGGEFTLSFSKGDEEMPLMQHKFSRVKDLAIFVEDNTCQTEFSYINRLRVMGCKAPTYHSEYKKQ